MKRISKIQLLLFASAVLAQFSVFGQHKSYSGIYPNLAMYNNEGECGTGAVVPWNDKLYVITYGPHLPVGSSDKLYIVEQSKDVQVYDKSVGGTPANRMIHEESNKLFIGPYIIDNTGAITVIDPKVMPGRLTGMARHLSDPKSKIYYATMEEGFYEYDINSKQVKELYTDVNLKSERYRKLVPGRDGKPQNFADLDGVHGKGVYSGQGVMVYSNNGEPGDLALTQYDIPSGSLSEWNGKDWKLVRRNQFVEVTGPGGIQGNKNVNDPIWATGWDHKSVILAVRDHLKGWSFYRLPKTSRSYDGAHGWNTEWPRIREIGDGSGDYLMTMHGMFWKFPKSFTAQNSKGIRPRSSYLKVIGDFARWNNQLVFGCDDSAQKEFLNKRSIKGNLEGAGQSNSNLWFIDESQLDQLGPTTAEGAVWIDEDLKDNLTSEAFLLAGWDKRNVWLKNHNSKAAKFTLEIDKNGDNVWSTYKDISVPANGSLQEIIPPDLRGEWIRVKVDGQGKYSALFSYHGNQISKQEPELFNAITKVGQTNYLGGYLYALGNNQRKMGVLAGELKDGEFRESGYYELDGDMNLVPSDNNAEKQVIQKHFSIEKNLVDVQANSVLVVDDLGRRWRFPKGDEKFDKLTQGGLTRLAREVVTERDLLNLHGTFYELPAENADGFAKVRPVSSHNMAIHDFASFRGLFVVSGIDTQGNQDHIIRSQDNKAAVWVGAIDDLWKLGKPKGLGGPWSNTEVKPNESSDPYLFGFYDNRTLNINHDATSDVVFNIQLDPSGNGEWIDYKSISVKSSQNLEFKFPKELEARWIRFTVDKPCHASTNLKYD
ncbi:hypothetical protein [Sphingobacterium daejeonense]|uniref:hypothetical protein n=1 Tax=Sphingobacterium daejeonense TaxID=371142 RepID=UPI003D319EEA